MYFMYKIIVKKAGNEKRKASRTRDTNRELCRKFRTGP
jgi:hypothetical protein